MKRHVVPRDWPGETVFIVASGPSVNTFPFERIAGRRTVAVKDGYLKVPYADVLLIGDHRYARRNPDLSRYLGELILYTDPDPLPAKLHDERMRFIPKVAGGGISDNPKELRGTFTTTALAIGYAIMRGATTVYLIGVDAKPGPNKERHFVGSLVEDWPQRYVKQRWGLGRLDRDFKRFGAQVFNLNPDSACRVFPFRRIEDV